MRSKWMSVAVLIASVVNWSVPSFALREQQSTEKRGEVLAGLEEALKSGNPVKFVNEAIQVANLVQPILQPSTGLEEQLSNDDLFRLHNDPDWARRREEEKKKRKPSPPTNDDLFNQSGLEETSETLFDVYEKIFKNAEGIVEIPITGSSKRYRSEDKRFVFILSREGAIEIHASREPLPPVQLKAKNPKYEFGLSIKETTSKRQDKSGRYLVISLEVSGPRRRSRDFILKLSHPDPSRPIIQEIIAGEGWLTLVLRRDFHDDLFAPIGYSDFFHLRYRTISVNWNSAGLEEGKAVVVSTTPVSSEQQKTLAQWADHMVGRAFDEGRAFEVPQLSDSKAADQIPSFVKRWAQERQQRELEPVLPEEQKAAEADLRASVALVKEAVGEIIKEYPASKQRLLEGTRFVFVLEPALLNAEETNFAAQVMGFPPKVHYAYGLASPGLYEEGDLNSDVHKAVVGVAGTFPYRVNGQPAVHPRTVYLSVARLKWYAALANAGREQMPPAATRTLNAIQSYLIHLDADPVTGRHQPWTPSEEAQKLEGAIHALWEKDVQAKRQQWADKDAKRVTETFVSVNLRNVFGDFSEIPPAAAKAAEAFLEDAKRQGAVKDFVLLRVGDHLLFDVSHQMGARNEGVRKLIASAVFRAIDAGEAVGLAFSAAWQATTSAFELLDWHDADWRYTERASQPTLRQVIVGGSPKASDGILFDLYASPNITTQQAIEGSHGTYAVVQNVDHPSKGLGITLPGGVTNKGLFDFLAVGKTSDHATRAIFPGKGSRFPWDEPLALAIPLGDLQVVVYNSQAGAEAVGGITGPATAPRIIDGKERRLSLKPVTLEQAPYLTSAKLKGELAGFAPTVIWGTQMFGNGEFDQLVDPIEGPEFASTQLNDIRDEFARILLGQGEAQPFLKTEAANRRALEAFKRFSARADKRQKVIEEGTLTTGVFKADIGSALGHTEPPKVFMAVARAVLEEAKQAGLIQDYLVKRRRHTIDRVSEFRVGDDIELHVTHTRPIGDAQIHRLAWRAFWAAGWVLSDVLGRKPYGLMQDLPNAKDLDAWVEAAMTQDVLRFIKENLEGLAREDPRAIDEEEIHKVSDDFQREYQAQQRGTRRKKEAADKAKFQFTGNVKGSGIGSAEGYITPGAWSILAFDKASPGAFSVPFMKAAQAALAAGAYTNLLFEVEKVRPEYDAQGKEIPQPPIILDFANLGDRALIQEMLGAVNEFQIKAIRTEDAEGKVRLVAVNSTDRLYQVTAGVYAGKDDPVSFMDSRFASFVFQWMQRELFITEGDERGSHWAFVLPVPMDRSSPGTHSIPIAVGLNFTVTKNGEVRGVEDVFESPSYEPIRSKAAYYNWAFIRSVGNFGPRGDAASVEATYPLWQNLARITAENSPYALTLAAGLEEKVASAQRVATKFLFRPENAGLALLVPEKVEVRIVVRDLGQRQTLYRLRPDLAGAFIPADEFDSIESAVSFAKRQLGEGVVEVRDVLDRDRAALRLQVETWLSGYRQFPPLDDSLLDAILASTQA